MPVSIRIKGDETTNEYKDALALQLIFQREFKNAEASGEILIISSATLLGQEVKDIDLIVIGNLDNYKKTLKTKTQFGFGNNRQELDLTERTVYINNFCFVIETKQHRAEDVQIDGLQLLVRYNRKLSDATTQSEKQKYSLKSFFSDRASIVPFVCNFIWLRSVEWESLKAMIGDNSTILTKHNYLPATFSTGFLFQLACTQLMPYTMPKPGGTPKGYSTFKCLKQTESFRLDEMNEIFNLFEKVRAGTGLLTRKKIEWITSKLLENQQYAQAIGEKFVVISGRAGTGKTVKLLRIAYDLATSKGARCLILTYNHALVSDIKRTLALSNMPDDIGEYSVNINTLHKFFLELLQGFGIVTKKFVPDYISRYQEYLQEMTNYIDSGLIQEKEIQELLKSHHDTVAWDYILIDESQDWSEGEKNVLFKIFGAKRVIVADGIDQLIRTQKKCNWLAGMKLDVDYRRTHEKRGLRQEVNLVNFINAFAREVGVNWELEPKAELVGGKIIISTRPYTKELHNRELKRCKAFGNSEYEMLLLVPPNHVEVTHVDSAERRRFKYTEEYERMGIHLWDGTSRDLRTQYPIDLNQHRLLQYESCRGLEGWTVVCLELDEFIKYKMSSFVEEESEQLALETFEQKRDKFVYLWSLIPLTRAIDTLIITLHDRNSAVGKALHNVYQANRDFVEWIE